jgi:hypothetical protein
LHRLFDFKLATQKPLLKEKIIQGATEATADEMGSGYGP